MPASVAPPTDVPATQAGRLLRLMTRLRGPLPKVLLVAFGTLAGLAAIEVAARVMAVRAERLEGRFDRDLDSIAGPRPRSEATLGQIIRRSKNPRIVYELRPRLDVVFAGARLTTSDSGHRGRDVARPKPVSTFRIVGIGDSYMFGQGVADEETYLARLTEPEKDFLSGRELETVNLAVPGFNTVMEVEMLRERGPALDPDLILIEIVGNDLDLPNFLWTTVDPWTPRRSFLADFIRSRLSGRREGAFRGPRLAEAPREEGAGQTFSRDSAQVPERYRSLVGLPAFEAGVESLAEFGRARRIPVLAMTHGVWFETDMLASLEANRIPVLVLRNTLRQAARDLGAPDYARSPLARSPADLHPSAAGHREIAKALGAWIREQLSRS